MLPIDTYGYRDLVPNQPKYPGRHLRMDPARWEGFGILSAEGAGDRTKELVRILDWLLYAPDSEPPARVPADVLIRRMREAADEVAESAARETDDKKRQTLEERVKALREMADIVAARTIP